MHWGSTELDMERCRILPERRYKCTLLVSGSSWRQKSLNSSSQLEALKRIVVKWHGAESNLPCTHACILVYHVVCPESHNIHFRLCDPRGPITNTLL